MDSLGPPSAHSQGSRITSARRLLLSGQPARRILFDEEDPEHTYLSVEEIEQSTPDDSGCAEHFREMAIEAGAPTNNQLLEKEEKEVKKSIIEELETTIKPKWDWLFEDRPKFRFQPR